MRNLPWIVIYLVMGLLVLAGCNRIEELPPLPHQNPQWSEYINMHSAEQLSREDKIRVRFVNDIVNDDQVGKDASAVLEVTPAVDGEVSYIGKREIELTPTKPLKSGQKYRVRVYGDRLKDIPKELGFYEFDVAVIKQQLEVRIDGLSAPAVEQAGMTLRGVLVTADTAAEGEVEKVLRADYQGKTLALQWQHESDSKHHKFMISDISRGAQAAQLLLTWNGRAINVESEGKYPVDIPALGDFKLVDVRALQQDHSYIELAFSEALDAQQNLKGLIQVSDQKVTLKTEGSVVRIYTDKGFSGEATVTIEPSVRSIHKMELKERQVRQVTFASQKPQVRFAGKGVVLPENQFLSIPIEAVNVNAVQVTAFRVYENNIGQFLQANNLSGNSDMQRVGRFLWRKTIKLDNVLTDQWNRYALDASELLRKYPGGLFQLTLSINRSNSTYVCSKQDKGVPIKKEDPPKNNEDLYSYEPTSGEESAESEDGYNAESEDYDGENTSRYEAQLRDRDNPCKDAYFRFASGVLESRNFMASNIGLIAKAGDDDQLHVIATRLDNAEPLAGVELTALNFQNQPISKGETDNKGMAILTSKSRPFYLIAKKAKQIGYLKVNAGNGLPLSHFDAGGEKLSNGIKGYIYGERGVWRPGDDIYLTFVLEDKGATLPANHPVTMELYNPKNQMLQRLTNSKPVGDFYTFKFRTADKAITGNWTAKALLGGASFTQSIKIETVMPNRLKVDLDFGGQELYAEEMPVKVKLSSQWLHGAIAANLRTDVAVKLNSVRTRFSKFADYNFDDPSRKFHSDRQVIFEGHLNDKGIAEFEANLPSESEPAGLLQAEFNSRVFEEGGAFSINNTLLPYHPYSHYVGIKLPKTEGYYGSYYLDTDYNVDIASVDAKGEPVALDEVQITLHRMDWRWWWDRSGDESAQFTSALYNTPVSQATLKTKDGHGSWKFKLSGENNWGRYFLRVCDTQGKHCSGQVFYADYPYWMGRSHAQDSEGANMLSFSADKPRYSVGETAKIQLPKTTQGRALVSVETGSRLLSKRWVNLSKDNTRFEVAVTAEMTPNAYVAVSLIQPHAQRDNDRPIRMYGVIPLLVDDPTTKLAPKLKVADEWRPDTDVNIEVSESQGRAMTYTLALVDDGLLALTNYKTPQLHDYFYKKEALGVTTWDLFDDVAGAYGGELERLLALGGDAEAEQNDKAREKKRFPPVVKFLGAFELAKGEHKKHTVRLPQYIGSVRVMVVAGKHGAYGSADKSVPVRQPLSMLATLPRVIGPGEDMLVPVSLFAMDKAIKEATLTIETNELFEVVGEKSTRVQFKGQEEQIGFLKLKVKETLGKGYVKFTARSGEHQTHEEVYLEVRTPNTPSTRYLSKALAPGDTWRSEIIPHGLAGTNRVNLEVSTVPPMNLDGRLQYLIQYPHGCIEQTTSSIFPQIYLPKLIKLTDQQKAQIQDHVAIAIAKLRGFQLSGGGFTYWPGYGEYDRWGSSYAGHFLVEASKQGYHVPPEMLTAWINHQRNLANNWVVRTEYNELDQSYRLYTLALAGKAELGAMNRLRESKNLSSAARWQLAAAYHMAGLPDVAKELVRGDKYEIPEYSYEGWSYGSRLRDKAILLDSLALQGNWDEAKEFADDIAKQLSADRWLSTQEVSFSLMAMARFVGKDGVSGGMTFTHTRGNKPQEKITLDTPMYSQALADFPLKGEQLTLGNPSQRNLYVTISVSGVPKSGTETESSKGLTLTVNYTDVKGKPVDISKLAQGTDLIAHLKIRNHNDRWLTNLALTQVVPSGWQIHNARLAESEANKITQVKNFDFQDIRDDRIYTYFRLNRGEEKEFQVLLNASYLGHYYAPGIAVEAMYDATIHARSKGQWVDVVKQGKP
ncbi:MAG: hypothetical protein HY080_05780 [Gammaproteobacteria bacterium]|nr:hypothetical protein [Gammaproteobacteria bacterium]